MSSNLLKKTGTVLTVIGFGLWAYGFFYGTFWYANPAMSYLEPVRLWVANYTQASIKPGLLEELFGLCVALLGMSLRLAAQYGKGD
jgi:hypothetical protein